MGLFEFIIIIVLIISLTEAATKILAPVSRRLAELLAESAREKRALRKGEGSAPAALPVEVIEALENRLARIEDRLDFLEELKAPAEHPALSGSIRDHGRP